ncbi:MAG: hypothetical protein MUQ26_00580 [Armatimonadetes bacterium]|nr:hypothetical protein [Armatimonadota bacterium]
MMRWTVAAGAVLACAVALVWGGPGGVAVQSAAGASMYAEEVVVGTILDAHRMYSSDGAEWYQCDLRVDATESAKSRLTVGQAVKAKYQLEKGLSPLQRPGMGDQIRAKLTAPKEVGGIVWTAQGLEMLGRGELVSPGDGSVVDLGARDAKLLVKMFAPLESECQRQTVELLEELAEREGERVRVQIFDMAQAAGRREMQRERIHCATVLVNNRFVFTLEGAEGTRRVVLSHHSNAEQSTYNSEDVITVAEQEIARLYPESGEPAEEKSAP